MKKSATCLFRAVGIGTAFAYFSTNVALAYSPEKSFWAERRQRSQKSFQTSTLYAGIPVPVNNFANPIPPIEHAALAPALAQNVAHSLPRGFVQANAHLLNALSLSNGNIRCVTLPKSGRPVRVVVHIQDVHENTDAQRNIGAAVQSLINNKAVGLVALEGSFTPMDVSRYRAFPDQDAIKKVADFLLREHKISGPAHTAFTSPQAIPPFVGIDDPAHYHKNVQAYLDSAPGIDNHKKALVTQSADLELRKKAEFSPILLAFDKKVQSYRENKISLGAYLIALSSYAADPKQFPNIGTFEKALKIESTLDFKQVEVERTQLVEKLTSVLSQKEIDSLLQQSVAYRLGQIRYAEFYQALDHLCRMNHIPLAQFPAMKGYVRYVLLTDGISPEKLLMEIAQLEKEDYTQLTQTPLEKELVRESTRLYLTQKLVDFTLTPQEWKEYLGLSNRDANLLSYESFYKEANARDDAMATNLLKEMNAQKTNTAVLVAGGFHTEGITEHLRNAGVAVIGFTPKIEKIDSASGSAYLSIFAQEKTPLEKMFQGEKLFLAKDGLPISVTEGLARLVVVGLKEADDPETPLVQKAQSIVGQLGALPISVTSSDVQRPDGAPSARVEASQNDQRIVVEVADDSSGLRVKEFPLLTNSQRGWRDESFTLKPAAFFRSLSLFIGAKSNQPWAQFINRHAGAIGLAGLLVEIPFLIWFSINMSFGFSFLFLFAFSYAHDYLESKSNIETNSHNLSRRWILLSYLLFPVLGIDNVGQLLLLLPLSVSSFILFVPLIHVAYDFISLFSSFPFPSFIPFARDYFKSKKETVEKIQAILPNQGKVIGWENTPMPYLRDILVMLERIPNDKLTGLQTIQLTHSPWFLPFNLWGCYTPSKSLVMVRIFPFRNNFRNTFAHELGHALEYGNIDFRHRIYNFAWEKGGENSMGGMLAILSNGLTDVKDRRDLENYKLREGGEKFLVNVYSFVNPGEDLAEFFRMCLLYPKQLDHRQEMKKKKNQMALSLGIIFEKGVFENRENSSIGLDLRMFILLSLWGHLVLFFPWQILLVSLILLAVLFIYFRIKKVLDINNQTLISPSFASLLAKIRSQLGKSMLFRDAISLLVYIFKSLSASNSPNIIKQNLISEIIASLLKKNRSKSMKDLFPGTFSLLSNIFQSFSNGKSPNADAQIPGESIWSQVYKITLKIVVAISLAILFLVPFPQSKLIGTTTRDSGLVRFVQLNPFEDRSPIMGNFFFRDLSINDYFKLELSPNQANSIVEVEMVINDWKLSNRYVFKILSEDLKHPSSLYVDYSSGDVRKVATALYFIAGRFMHEKVDLIDEKPSRESFIKHLKRLEERINRIEVKFYKPPSRVFAVLVPAPLMNSHETKNQLATPVMEAPFLTNKGTTQVGDGSSSEKIVGSSLEDATSPSEGQQTTGQLTNKPFQPPIESLLPDDHEPEIYIRILTPRINEEVVAAARQELIEKKLKGILLKEAERIDWDSFLLSPRERKIFDEFWLVSRGKLELMHLYWEAKDQIYEMVDAQAWDRFRNSLLSIQNKAPDNQVTPEETTPSLSIVDPLFRAVIRLAGALGLPSKTIQRVDDFRRFWNRSFGPLLETYFIFQVAAASGLGPLAVAAVFTFPILHAVMEAIFDVVLGRQNLSAVVPRMVDRLKWGLVFALPFALSSLFGIALPSIDVGGQSWSLETLGVTLVHAVNNILVDHNTRADALSDAKRTVAILKGEYSDLRPTDIPLLTSSVNDVFTPTVAESMSRRLQNDFEYRHEFVRAFATEWARAGLGTIRPRVAPAFWSFLKARIVGSGTFPNTMDSSFPDGFLVIEEIVSRDDLPSVHSLVESVNRINAQFEERPITVRLIPGDPSLTADLERIVSRSNDRRISVRPITELTTEALSKDFESWLGLPEQKGMAGVPLRIAVSVSKGVKIIGNPASAGQSAYLDALRAALFGMAARPVDFLNFIYIAEAVVHAA